MAPRRTATYRSASDRPWPARSRRRWRGPRPAPRRSTRSPDGTGRRSGRAASSGMPGPASSTVSRTRPASVADRRRRPCRRPGRTCRRCRAGRPSSRSSHSGGAWTHVRRRRRIRDSSARRARLGDDAGTGRRSAPARTPRSTGSASGGSRVASNRASHSRSSRSRRIRFDSRRRCLPKAVRYHVGVAVLRPGRGSCGPR